MKSSFKNSSIGLTGGIGCGKSAAGRILGRLGLRRLDTDVVARDVVLPGSAGLTQLVECFGTGVLSPDGTLDRAKLGELVFADPGARKELEEILHPLIWQRVLEFLNESRAQEKDCVVEVPLLFENERQAAFDEVWVVAASPEVQRARIKERSGWSDQEISRRLESQMPLEEKCRRADRVIWNNGALEKLEDGLRVALHSIRGGMKSP